MLGKLFKYEIKSTSRIFLTLYFIIIGVSAVSKLFNVLSEKLDIMLMPSAFLMSLYIVTVIGMFIATVIIMVRRFYTNLTGDEGYLMFTLPVDVWKHVFVKTVTAVIWTLTGIAAALVSIFIVAFYREMFGDIYTLLSTVYESFKMQYEMNIYLFAVKIAVIAVLSCAAGYLMIFTAISFGQLFHSHRAVYSVAIYFALYTLNQILSVISFAVISAADKTLWNRFLNNDLKAIGSWLLLYTGIGVVFMICVYFFCSTYLLKNKLNLE
jgi:hypothetical protein